MLPESNSQYGSLSYWEGRYETEEEYDWFPSVYHSCVEQVFAHLEEVAKRQHALGKRKDEEDLLILHLGTGNSSLVADLYHLFTERYASVSSPLPYKLVQVAVDYSSTVIDKMKVKHAALPDTVWRVADIRDLNDIREEFPYGFDLVIDKGTMDALQADKENPAMEADIARMLREVSQCLASNRHIYGRFIQITWEIPLYRLHYTLGKDEGFPYAWKEKETHRLIGDSDMYRIFCYEVSHEESALTN